MLRTGKPWRVRSGFKKIQTINYGFTLFLKTQMSNTIYLKSKQKTSPDLSINRKMIFQKIFQKNLTMLMN